MSSEKLTHDNYQWVLYQRLREIFGQLQETQLGPKLYDSSFLDRFFQRLASELYIQAQTLSRKNAGLSHQSLAETSRLPEEESVPAYEPNEMAVNAALLKSSRVLRLPNEEDQFRKLLRIGDKTTLIESFPGLAKLAIIIDVLHNSNQEYISVYQALLKLFSETYVLAIEELSAEVDGVRQRQFEQDHLDIV